MALLPKLEARYYTYIGFACALFGMFFVLATMVSMFDIFGVGGLVPWPIPAAFAMCALLAATLSFHQMGTKKVAL